MTQDFMKSKDHLQGIVTLCFIIYYQASLCYIQQVGGAIVITLSVRFSLIELIDRSGTRLPKISNELSFSEIQAELTIQANLTNFPAKVGKFISVKLEWHEVALGE